MMTADFTSFVFVDFENVSNVNLALVEGRPVYGSMGIDASFAGRMLEPFQSMVMADYADRWHGVLGSRGRRPGEAQAKLLLTGLPRGSFGLELAPLRADGRRAEGVEAVAPAPGLHRPALSLRVSLD
jgi:hypothetical protein